MYAKGLVHSHEASALKSAYVAAKHGILGFCRVTAEEGARRRSNALTGQSITVRHGWHMGRAVRAPGRATGEVERLEPVPDRNGAGPRPLNGQDDEAGAGLGAASRPAKIERGVEA